MTLDIKTYLQSIPRPPTDKETAAWFAANTLRWPEGFEHPWKRKMVIAGMLEDIEKTLNALPVQDTTTLALLGVIVILKEINQP